MCNTMDSIKMVQSLHPKQFNSNTNSNGTNPTMLAYTLYIHDL